MHAFSSGRGTIVRCFCANADTTRALVPGRHSGRRSVAKRVEHVSADAQQQQHTGPPGTKQAAPATSSSQKDAIAAAYVVAPHPPASRTVPAASDSNTTVQPRSRGSGTPLQARALAAARRRSSAASQPAQDMHNQQQAAAQVYESSADQSSRRMTNTTPNSSSSRSQSTNDTATATNRSSSHTIRSNIYSNSRHNPSRAFLQAGMPPGLWVLPLSATADPAPAPPPVAPGDPQQLLQVLQAMPPPSRRVVIFKAGGYVYSDLETLIEQSGLSHVLRLTNLIRKAHCVLAKARWDNGRAVNLAQHRAAADKARVPFLTVQRLDLLLLVEAVRPVLVRKRIVVEAVQPPKGQEQQQRQQQFHREQTQQQREL